MKRKRQIRRQKKPFNKIYIDNIVLIQQKKPIIWNDMKSLFFLKKDHIMMQSTSNRDHFSLMAKKVTQFYKTMAMIILWHRFQICYKKFQDKYPKVKTPTLVLRKMKRRFGSLNSRFKMVLNIYLVQLSIAEIDAVIFHELTHLLHFNHTKFFYECLNDLYPLSRDLEKPLKKKILLIDY